MTQLMRVLSILMLAYGITATPAQAKPLPEFSSFDETIALEGDNVPDFDYSGIAALSDCSASVVSFGQSENSKAVLMTNAHCIGMLDVPTDTIYRDKPYARNVSLFKSLSERVPARITKIIWGAITTFDLAFLELNMTYKQLTDLGVRSRRISTQPVAIGATIILASGYHRFAKSCPVLGIIPFLHEDQYRNSNAYKYRCGSIPGTSGSPLIDMETGMVVGSNYTANDSGGRCTFNNPCEVDAAGNVTVDRGAGYGDPVHAAMGCLNAQQELDLATPGCALPH